MLWHVPSALWAGVFGKQLHESKPRTTEVHTTPSSGGGDNFRFLVFQWVCSSPRPWGGCAVQSSPSPCPVDVTFQCFTDAGASLMNQAQSAAVPTWENYCSRFHHSLVEHPLVVRKQPLSVLSLLGFAFALPASKHLHFLPAFQF